MSRQVKTGQGSNTLPKSSGSQGPTSMPHTSQSTTKSTHSMSQEGQSMPQGPQPMPRGQASMPRDTQSMQNNQSMMYGSYSMPPQGAYPMNYGGPPPMSHGGFPMPPGPQSMSGGMYGGHGFSSMPRMDNKNRMKTLSKTQRESMTSDGFKTGISHQRCADTAFDTAQAQKPMSRMNMDYEGRYIDSRGRLADYSHNLESSGRRYPYRYMFNRDMPREEQVMYDYGMPEYMYGNMREYPDLMMDMDMYGRYVPFFDQYADDDDDDDDDDYAEGMMGNMMSQGYMDATGCHTDFPGMHFPERRTMNSTGRYGDSFDR